MSLQCLKVSGESSLSQAVHRQNIIYIPQKIKFLNSTSEQDQSEKEKVFCLEDILENNNPIVFLGSSRYGKTALAKEIEKQVLENYQENNITTFYISAKNKNAFDITQISQEVDRAHEVKVIIIIDDFDDVILKNKAIVENIQKPTFHKKCKIIYFVNTSIANKKDYQRWIQTENILFQYEIMQFNKKDIYHNFENYLSWDQCISNINLSEKMNHDIIKSIVEKIENNLNIIEILMKIIKFSSIVSDFEQEAGNAMMILKELKCIFKNEDFSFIRLNNSSFEYLSFTNCNFEGSYLQNVNISKCWFIQCNLKNVVWQNMVKYDTQLNLKQQIKSYTFQNDNSLLIVTFLNSRIELWHLKTCKRISLLRKEKKIQDNLNASAFNRNFLASQSLQKQSAFCEKIKIQICSSGKIIRLVRTKMNNNSINFSHNNTLMALISRKNILLWDNKESKPFFENSWQINIQQIQFSIDDKLIAINFVDHSICIWNIDQKQSQFLAIKFTEKPQYSTFSPDLGLVSFAFNDRIVIQEVAFETEIVSFQRKPSAQNNLIQFSSDGKFLAYASKYGALTLLGLSYEKDDQQLTVKQTELKSNNINFQWIKDWNSSWDRSFEIESIHFQKNEKSIILGDTEGKIKFYDYSKDYETKIYDDFYMSPAFSPNGKIIAFGSSKKESVFLWDIQEGRLQLELVSVNASKEEGHVNLISFPFDDILSYTFNSQIKLWNIKTRQLISEFKCQQQIIHVQIISLLKLEICCLDKSIIQIWIVEKYQQILKFQIDTQLKFIKQTVFSPFNNFLAVCGDGLIMLWDTKYEKKCFKFQVSISNTQRIDFSHKESILAFSGQMSSFEGQEMIRLWNIKERQTISTINLASLIVNYIKFSPNGQLLACGISNSIKIWDISELPVIKDPITLLNHSDVYFLDFSQDGTKLISRSREVSLQIWQIEILKGDEFKSLDESNKQKYKIFPLYAFTNEFDFKADETALAGSSIVTDNDINLVQIFLQNGGQR